MKIALIYLGRKGGGPVYSLEIAKRLNNKSELLCFLSSKIDNLDKWKDLNTYKVSTYSNKLEFILSLFNIKKFIDLKRKIKQFSPDVIYYPFFHFWIPIINFMFPKIPKVFTLHDPVMHIGERSLLMKVLKDMAIKKSSRIIILSSAFKNIVAEKGVSMENIDVIPHGIFDYYLKMAKKIKKERHDPCILFFGRLIEYKGLDVLLKAFPVIKREMPKCKLLIVGPGSIKPYEKYLIDGVEVENRWIEEKEIAGYFSQSDLVVCPYVHASQSGVIPIAYVFKVPVIATNIYGLKEQVNHGMTGYLIEPNNIGELARWSIALLKDKKKRKQMGENGFKKANNEWNWDIVSEKVLNNLKKCAE